MENDLAAAHRPALILRPGKRRTIKYLLGCLLFVIIGVSQLFRREAVVLGWLCVIFFGLGVAVFAVQFIPSASYLRLEGDGFRFCSLFRESPFILWQEVSRFRAAGVPPSGYRLVVFDWDRKSNAGVRRINRYLVDATDGLPDSYGLRPEELADLLNTWRSRASHEFKDTME